MADIKNELLSYLELDDFNGEQIDDYYVVELIDYDLFSEVYNKLERNIDCERDSDNSTLDIEYAHITYIYKDTLVELVAIFDDDDYTLNIFMDGEEETTDGEETDEDGEDL